MITMKKIKSDNSGYFSNLLKKLGGDNVSNNLKGFEFRKEVINQYTDLSINNPMEFKLEKNAGVIYINHIGKWDLKCHILNNGNIASILVDLSKIPPDQQAWWEDHII